MSSEPRLIVALSVITAVLFAAMTTLYFYLTISALIFALGYLIRIGLSYNPGSIGIYIAMTMFTLLPPCGFIAQSYMLLPRLATWLDAEDCLFLRSRIIVRIFVWSDVFTFWIQGGGGGLTAAQSSQMIQTIGKWTVLGGLALQLASLATFSTLVAVFGRRLKNRHPSKWNYDPVGNSTKWAILRQWKTMYGGILLSCLFILIRCGFRVAEFSQGHTGTLRTTEWYLYVFDVLPIFCPTFIYVFIWPPRVMVEDIAYNLREISPQGSNSQTTLNKSGV